MPLLPYKEERQMQQIEQKQEAAIPDLLDPTSQPLEGDSDHNGSEVLSEEEANAIFRLAEAEIQPILRKMRKERFIGWVQGFLCVSLMLFSLSGIVWQCITYPHTLVILYAKANPAQITATLDIPTRTLAPITITRSVTAPTTGTGHQDARQATGNLIFYNGSANPQTVPIGTVFTGADSLQVSTDQSVTIPAANAPHFGQASITATTIRAGSTSNIHSLDINGTVSSSLFVKNLQAFTGGRDARTYKAVGQSDIDSLTSTVQQTLETAFTTAFPVRPGEEAQPTNCHTTTTADHGLGQEAQAVTVKTSKTCSAVAYNQSKVQADATQLFTAQTKPGAQFKLVESLTPQVISVSPLTVIISGKWAYTFTPDYQQFLAEKIAGDTPAQARKILLHTGVISYASIPSTLPPDSIYINFLVLVG